MSRVTLLATLIALAVPTMAVSQEAPAPAAPAAPAPDKSGFTLFDPTPEADLRALCTDRPTKSTGPCTVDAGHLQIESDVVNGVYDHSGGMNTTTTLYTNPTVKLGLTNTLDTELNIVPYETISTRDRATGRRTSLGGVGDVFVRMKWNLMGDDGGNVAVAIVSYVKFPTAEPPIGDGAVEEGVIAPVSINLPMSWQLVIDPEVDMLRNAADNGRHINASGLLSFTRPFTKTISLSAEIWTDVNFDPTGKVTQVSADFGAAWIPAAHPNFQLDGGVNFGLNRVTPAAQLYLGVSRRF